MTPLDKLRYAFYSASGLAGFLLLFTDSGIMHRLVALAILAGAPFWFWRIGQAGANLVHRIIYWTKGHTMNNQPLDEAEIRRIVRDELQQCGAILSERRVTELIRRAIQANKQTIQIKKLAIEIKKQIQDQIPSRE